MDSYPKQEMDLKIKAIETKMETDKETILTVLDGHSDAHDAIYNEIKEVKKQTTITNGKVRKHTMALIALGSFLGGLGIINLPTLL